jgi:hypothetical protein
VTRPDLALLARLQRQLRRGFATGSERHPTGAFTVYVWPHSDVFYRTRALPVARPRAGWREEIRAMLKPFAAVGRVPRLEIIEELWPDLPRALLDAGFACEMRAPILVAEPGSAGEDEDGVAALLDASTPQERLAALIATAEATYGMPAREPPAGELAQLPRELRDGTTIAAACLDGGRFVAGASLIGVAEEAELAGVRSAPGHRRRGLAAAACRRVLARFARLGGELVWLSAGDEGSERLYRSLGFRHAGTQLNMVRP